MRYVKEKENGIGSLIMKEIRPCENNYQNRPPQRFFNYEEKGHVNSCEAAAMDFSGNR